MVCAAVCVGVGAVSVDPISAIFISILNLLIIDGSNFTSNFGRCGIADNGIDAVSGRPAGGGVGLLCGFASGVGNLLLFEIASVDNELLCNVVLFSFVLYLIHCDCVLSFASYFPSCCLAYGIILC
eukprot:TRINITY_DN10085_c0_g1_i1.p1 TRINITY_DN10085_c0_g1~~TRINITY_DN10085_c0_g1_i1.p1  ORF type:complete len:126 (+),score=19.16 TRINITY_DN10085_c0_g1_i1:96-473(+)